MFRERIGKGFEAKIYLENGEAIRVPHKWNIHSVREELSNHSAVSGSGVPTFQYYRVDEHRKLIRMPDLTNGGEKMVVSLSDIHYDSRKFSKVKKTVSKSNGGLPENTTGFITDNRAYLQLLINAGICVLDSGYFILIGNNNRINLFIGDMGNGIWKSPLGKRLNKELEEKASLEYIEFLLRMPGAIFPSLMPLWISEAEELGKMYNVSENVSIGLSHMGLR